MRLVSPCLRAVDGIMFFGGDLDSFLSEIYLAGMS